MMRNTRHRQSSPGGTARGSARPAASCWHVWTDEKGVSHQTRSELSAFEQQGMGGTAPLNPDVRS
jgi:hypothetical protein